MTFPNLRSLSLSFEIPEGASHLASALLQRHRKIESLCWKVQCAGSIVFDCELPFLKELSGNFVDVSDILSARTDVCRPLTSIQNLVVKGHFWNNIFPSLNTSRITKLHIRDFHGVDDIYRLPKEFRELVSLRVDVSSPFWDESIGRFRTCLKVKPSSHGSRRHVLIYSRSQSGETLSLLCGSCEYSAVYAFSSTRCTTARKRRRTAEG